MNEMHNAALTMGFGSVSMLVNALILRKLKFYKIKTGNSETEDRATAELTNN